MKKILLLLSNLIIANLLLATEPSATVFASSSTNACNNGSIHVWDIQPNFVTDGFKVVITGSGYSNSQCPIGALQFYSCDFYYLRPGSYHVTIYYIAWGSCDLNQGIKEYDVTVGEREYNCYYGSYPTFSSPASYPNCNDGIIYFSNGTWSSGYSPGTYTFSQYVQCDCGTPEYITCTINVGVANSCPSPTVTSIKNESFPGCGDGQVQLSNGDIYNNLTAGDHSFSGTYHCGCGNVNYTAVAATVGSDPPCTVDFTVLSADAVLNCSTGSLDINFSGGYNVDHYNVSIDNGSLQQTATVNGADPPNAQFSSLPPGDYIVTVDEYRIGAASCHCSQTHAVTINSSQKPAIDFSCSPGNLLTTNYASSASPVTLEWKLNNEVVYTETGANTLNQNGITVAGGNGAGNAANQLNSPLDVFVDAFGNVYVSDQNNHRVQKWAPGATAGITVAGGNGAGQAANQLNTPIGIYLDQSNNLYIADYRNQRIQKWAPGATEGITVAGGNGYGTAANQFRYPVGIHLDANNNLYVAELYGDRVQKFTPGATDGITVAGGNGEGSAANQLLNSHFVCVDGSGNVYVTDESNPRVQKWAPGAIEGVTVAGGNGEGNALNQLYGAQGIFLDAAGNLYVSDQANQRIVKWAPGASGGTVILGGNGYGSAPNQFQDNYGMRTDASGNIYVVDVSLNRVQKFAKGIKNTFTPTTSGIYTVSVTSADGCTATSDPVNVILAAYYRDADADGYGDINNSIQNCNHPAGYVVDNSDCDDNDASIHPGAPEVCDGKDNDCNGTIDDGVQTTYYLDADNDGYGNAANSVQNCTQPSGYVTNNSDCDDNDASIHPGAPEVCDGKDNDCNGLIDDGVQTTYYLDADNDGYGDINNSIQNCNQPAGYVVDNSDCDDNDASIHPGAPEICDGKDNDCNGLVEDNVLNTYYRDADGDGYGNIAKTRLACTQPSGYVTNNTDCKDNNASINPGKTEICGNNIDDNCNGQIDEGCSLISVAPQPVSVNEGNKGQINMTFVVSLSAPAITASQVSYQTVAGTATAGTDYLSTSGTLNFKKGQSSKTVVVKIIGDKISEANETLSLQLSNPVNLVISQSSALGTIINDDGASFAKQIVQPKYNDFKNTGGYKLVIPTLLQRTQIWNIQGLPASNIIILVDSKGQTVLKTTNYKNNTSFNILAVGLYFYEIILRDKDGKPVVYRGKLMIIP